MTFSEIKTVFYLKNNKTGYCISNYSNIENNKKPSDNKHYNSATFSIDNGKIIEIHVVRYNQHGVAIEEYLVKYFYDNNKIVDEEI